MRMPDYPVGSHSFAEPNVPAPLSFPLSPLQPAVFDREGIGEGLQRYRYLFLQRGSGVALSN